MLQIYSDGQSSDIAFGYGSSASFTENMRISGNGNLVVRGSVTANSSFYTSDSRYKKNLLPINGALEKITLLQGYNYYWKDNEQDSSLQSGVIAQEVQKIFPELVRSDDKGFLSVNYIGLIPYLIESIKELKKENEELKTMKSEMAELKKMVDKLSGK